MQTEGERMNYAKKIVETMQAARMPRHRRRLKNKAPFGAMRGED